MRGTESELPNGDRIEALQLEDLPNEIWLQLLSYVPFTDKLQLRLVCKRWHNLIFLPDFMKTWKIFIDSRNISEIIEYVKSAPLSIIFENVELRCVRYTPELGKLLATIGPQVRLIKIHNSFTFADPYIRAPIRNAGATVSDRSRDHVDTIRLSVFDRLVGVYFDYYDNNKIIVQQLYRELRSHPSNGAFKHLGLYFTPENTSLVLQILSKNAHTLNYLDLYFGNMPRLQLKELSCIFTKMKGLTKLKLSGKCPFEVLSTILLSLPITAPICCIDLSGLLTLNDQLLDVLAEKWSSTIEDLGLTFCPELTETCTTIIRKLRPTLRTVSIAFCSEMPSTCLINGLAYETNTMLQELSIEEIGSLSEADVCMFAQRLPNLRKLSIDNSTKSVTNKSIAAIFKHQTSLQELSIEGCSHVSDDGLVGYGDQPYSISRLRGLRLLNMMGLPHPTDRTLKFALQFPELRTLKLGYNYNFSESGIEQLTINCPAVEELTLKGCSLVDDRSVEHIARNMKRLRILNLGNCSKLTKLCFDVHAKDWDLHSFILNDIDAVRSIVQNECTS